MSGYGRDATETSHMLTFVLAGVSHQVWYEGGWHDIVARCGIRASVTLADDLRAARRQPINCMLCLDAITETMAYDARRDALRRGRQKP